MESSTEKKNNGEEVKVVEAKDYSRMSRRSLRKERQRLLFEMSRTEPRSANYIRLIGNVKVIEEIMKIRAEKHEAVISAAKNVAVVVLAGTGLVLSMKMDSDGTLPRWTGRSVDRLDRMIR